MRILRDSITDLIREHFRSQFPEAKRNQTEFDGVTQFLISGCMGLLIWWLESGVPYSAEEIFLIFRRLATQGLRSFLAAN